MKKFTLFMLIIFFFISVFAQKSEKEFKKAHVHYTYGDYDTALKLHYKLHQRDSLHVKNNYYLGICYLEAMQNEKALDIFQKIKFFRMPYKSIILEYDFYHDTYRSNVYFFNYAKALHLNHQFEKAITYYKDFLSFLNIKYPKKYDDVKVFVVRQIEMCKNGLILLKYPVHHIEIKNMGEKINSKYDDIAPLLDLEEHVLLFTSRRPHNDSTETQRMDLDYEYMEDIYMSVKGDDHQHEWNEPFRIDDEVNTKDHDAGVGLSASGCHLFIYRNNNTGEGNLYETHINDEGKWSTPEKMPEGINTKYTESHATISADGTRLFFTSNRPGMGKTDIYFSQKMSNDENILWTKPILLDSMINTSESEESPFLSYDGNTLYFSSKGHNSMGGYDIFKSEYNPITKRWSKAENLGYPINTADNDVFFVWTKHGTHAYFSSHHEDSYGEHDLYLMTIDTTYVPNQCNAAAYFLNHSKKNIPSIVDDTLFITTTMDTLFTGSLITFSSKFTSDKNYEIDHMYWKFGNTQYDCHEEGIVTYYEKGQYDITLVMYLNINKNKYRLEVLKTIQVLDKPKKIELLPVNQQISNKGKNIKN